MTKRSKPDRDKLRKTLTPLQFSVTQEEGTEPPFDNAYWNHKEPGIYVDIVSGEPLFLSLDKYDSKTGWPSFTRPLEPGSIVTRTDQRLGVPRTEVRSRLGGSHLGHVFEDGPPPVGRRYCINSAALRFVPLDELEAEGLGRYRTLFGLPIRETAGAASPTGKAGGASAASPRAKGAATPPGAIATLAAGCFWGVQEILRKLPGVMKTTAGYTGGTTASPTYQQVCSGRTGHAEAVQVRFDPQRISYELLLEYFFRLHDPTTPNRQGQDVGTQYRSVIFYHGDKQHRIAQQVKERVDRSGKWKRPVVTEILPAATFYPAEEYHQDYLQNHPDGYSCHYLRD